MKTSHQPVENSCLLVKIALGLFLAGIFSLPFMQLVSIYIFGSAVCIADVFFGISGLLWIVAVTTRSIDLRSGRFYWLIGFFILAVLITMAVAPVKSMGRLIIQGYLIGLGVLCYNLIRTMDNLRRVWIVWVGTSLVTTMAIFITIFLFYAADMTSPDQNPILSGFGSLPVGHYPRVRGFFLNMNMAANFLAIGACFAFGLAGMASRRPPYWALAAALSICVATVFTVSAALGGLAIAIGLYARQFHNKVQRFSILKAVFPAATFFAFCLLVYTAVYPTKHGAEISLTPSPRWHTWTTSFHSFLAHPIFGNGLGVPLADVRNVTPAGVHEYLTDPHNAWLSVAGQTGVVGLVAYCALVVWLFRSIRGGNIVGETPAIIRSALFGAFVVVLYQTMSGSVEDMRHVWLLFGLIAAATEIRQEIAGTVEN